MNNTGWIIYEPDDAVKNSWFIEKLQKELKACELKLVYTDKLRDLSLNDADLPLFIINRSRNADIAYHYEEKGVRVFNPGKVTEIGNDKDLSYALADRLGIKYMPYISVETVSYTEISRMAYDFGYPFVMKPSDGHGGRHVFLIRDNDELHTALQDIMHTIRIHPYKKLILQKPCSVAGRDLRIYLINNNPVAAMLRCAGKDEDFRANFSLGGTASLITPTNEEKNMAEKISKALPSDFIGIDLIYDGDGVPVFNEIEDAVGSRMLYTYTDIDIIKMFADHILHSLS